MGLRFQGRLCSFNIYTPVWTQVISKNIRKVWNVMIWVRQTWTIQCSDTKTNSSLQHLHLTKLGFCYCSVCLSRWLWAYLEFIPVASTFVQGKKQDDLLLNFGVLVHFSEYWIQPTACVFHFVDPHHWAFALFFFGMAAWTLNSTVCKILS
jgi:hypothetical protein